MLQLKNITKNYYAGDLTVTALNDVSINFRQNEFVSILGPSGCGKTTMLNIIGGLDKYTTGDLVINTQSTKDYTDRDWDTYRNHTIGFVFQSYNLIPHQTVIANVELALTLSGVGRRERRARAMQALEKVGLTREANKRPNQLSGGQMQRVAIARALVNDPKIILADEPTGALDTETSIQVMDLLKEVANDRLVIMVTHNPELAEKYSTRIIRLLDGKVVSDSNPIGKNEYEQEVAKAKSMAESDGNIKQSKAQMKLKTAFGLSLSNLHTKRARTVLTSIAGSIGIIGIALVMAVSSGFQNYVYALQSDTLSTYPVTISEATVDLSDFNKLLEGTQLDKFPVVKKVFTRKMFDSLTNMLQSNNISDEYLAYINTYLDEQNAQAAKTDQKWKYSLQKTYGLDVNNYIFANIKFVGTENVMPVDMFVRRLEKQFDVLSDSDLGIDPEFVRDYIPTMCELPDSIDLLDSQYEVLEGSWPTNANEVVLVVDSYNRIPDISMALLGFNEVDDVKIEGKSVTVKFAEGQDELTFDEVLNTKFYYVNNDVRYTAVSDMTGPLAAVKTYLNSNAYIQNFYDEETMADMVTQHKAEEITISGIVRIKEGVQQGILQQGIAYTSALVTKILDDGKSANNASAFVSGADIYNPMLMPNEMLTVFLNPFSTEDQKKEVAQAWKTDKYSARELGVDSSINKLSFYSLDYDAKEQLKKHLDAWNERDDIKDTADEVHYSDSMSMLFSSMNTIVDAVEIVLICFTSISLVVSSIMIGIITYVSVVERTKEIGVLRSLGARKKDISRIFNAETFLIGLFAGIIGVVASYLLSIPINLIAGHYLAGLSRIASLQITDALLLVGISFVLTLIAGLVPSRIAANKDPVVALRTE